MNITYTDHEGNTHKATITDPHELAEFEEYMPLGDLDGCQREALFRLLFHSYECYDGALDVSAPDLATPFFVLRDSSIVWEFEGIEPEDAFDRAESLLVQHELDHERVIDYYSNPSFIVRRSDFPRNIRAEEEFKKITL